jgi:nitrous oxidase accessory protein NosD
MRRSIGVLTVVAVIAVCLTSASSALAAKTVCGSGCAYTSIQSAINAAAPGATITIGAGSYAENVVVNKSVTLKGSGPHTVVYPAVSNPVCSPGSLCEGAASTIILVQADNVTITKLKLEGDNPSLTSGVIVGGKDIDARNGIITNHAVGTFNNLTVSKVVIADIYLRGVYASSGGSFNFNHDTVENVQGEGASIAMFNFEGTGVMSHNKVVSANDAISANWSKGTQFLDNKVSKSGSGIHTDNNGGSGGSADLISGNKISECSKDGYGIWVFAPYLSANVDSNKIKGCYIGIAAFGSQASGEGPTFSGNTVDGTGATTSDPSGTYGAYLTTDLLGFAFGDLTATLSGNSFEHSGTGVLVTQTSPTEGQPAGGQATVTASNNTIHANTVGANGEAGTVVNAENNWWGCKQGPNASPSCDTATGTVSFTPWLTTKP